jgi:hypothetical protein
MAFTEATRQHSVVLTMPFWLFLGRKAVHRLRERRSGVSPWEVRKCSDFPYLRRFLLGFFALNPLRCRCDNCLDGTCSPNNPCSEAAVRNKPAFEAEEARMGWDSGFVDSRGGSQMRDMWKPSQKAV